MPYRLELLTQAPKKNPSKDDAITYANNQKKGLFKDSTPTTIPYKELKTNKEKIKSAFLIVADHVNLIPWREITYTVGDAIGYVVKYSAIGIGKTVWFVVMDVIPFVTINLFKVVAFLVKLLLFFVTDMFQEFKSTKPVGLDNDRMPGLGQNQNINIHDNHGTINIFNR